MDLERVSQLKDEPILKETESLEVISFLRSTQDEVAMVCRVKFKDPTLKVEEVFAGSFDEVQVLERSRSECVCYLRGKRKVNDAQKDLLGPGVYLAPPYEIQDGRIRATFLANAKEIQRVLGLLNRASLPYKVISLMDAKFLPDSPLGQLTEKQRKVLTRAFERGYYDVPRRISSEDLAKELRIREPTLVMHRRKAERRLLGAIL
jgi:predicted DNA binding protein